MNTTTDFKRPALYGGLVMGVLSALPVVAVGNVCCCLWVVSGGVVAAYVLQQNQPAPMTAGDGALAGLLAGLFGACVYLVISIPVSLMLAPVERLMLGRIAEMSGSMPPQFRGYLGDLSGGGFGLLRSMFGFMFMLVAGAIFSTIGGLLGALIFKKSAPPAATDQPAGA